MKYSPIFVVGMIALVLIGVAFSQSSTLVKQENPTSIAMQVKIFSNPISNNNDVRKEELEKDFNKWMQDNWDNINLIRIDTSSNSGYLHIIVLYKYKYNK